jgi:hypothetical protein
MLAVIEIPFESGGHGDEAVRTEDAGFFGERICKARGRDAFGAKERVAVFGDVGDREDFAVAEAYEAFADAELGFEFREALSSLASGRQARREFIEAVDTGDLFYQINFAFDFGAPGGLGAFPRGEQGAFRAAILSDANGSEAERAENGFNFLVGNVRAHDAKELSAGQLDFFRGAFAGIDIDNT